jgi:hypothetical protein
MVHYLKNFKRWREEISTQQMFASATAGFKIYGNLVANSDGEILAGR